MKELLTEKQKEYLVYIDSHIKEYHYAPTYAEIAEKFKVKVGTAQRYVEYLTNKGWIIKDRGWRNIKIAP